MIARKPLILGTALAALTLPAMAAAPAANAPGWTVDKAASELGFVGIGDGSEFKGVFGGWDAKINFDPAKLAASSAAVTIDMSTAATGDPSRDEPLLEPSWFSTAAFPTATFATSAITSAGGNNYVADGTLTIRGVSQPVKLPFTLTITGNKAEMAGSLTLDKNLWSIGKGSWQDKSVDPAVKVNVKISATKAS